MAIASANRAVVANVGIDAGSSVSYEGVSDAGGLRGALRVRFTAASLTVEVAGDLAKVAGYYTPASPVASAYLDLELDAIAAVLSSTPKLMKEQRLALEKQIIDAGSVFDRVRG